MHDDARAPVHRVQRDDGGQHPPHQRLDGRAAFRAAARRRLDVHAPEALVGGDGRDRAHGFFPAVSASISFSGIVPIDPAPSVITTSPDVATFVIAGTTSASVGATSTGTVTARRTAAASASSVAPAIGCSPAG